MATPSVLSWLDESKERALLALLFATALVIRLVGLALVPDMHLSTNAEAILQGANLIRQGDFVFNPDYPTLVPPLLALFVAAIQSIFGDGLIAVKVVQILLDACTVLLVFAITKRILPRPVAVLTAFATAVYPISAFSTLYIGTEALFSFLLAAFVLMALKALDSDRKALFLAAGLSLGLASLARGTTQYFPLFFVAFLLWYNLRAGRKVVLQAAAFIVGFAVVVGPWTARNVVVLDAFVMTSTPGLPILNGASEEFWLIKDRRHTYPAYFQYLREHKGIAAPPNPSWVERDEFYKKAALERYRQRWEEQPWSFVPFLLKKSARLWYATETGNNEWLILAAHLPLYIFSVYGLWLLFRHAEPLAWFIALLLAYFAAVHVAVYALFRFMVPVMPYMIMLASYGLLSALSRLKWTNSRWAQRFMLHG